MLKATPNPVEHTFPTPPPHVSFRTFSIAGILTTVFGLDEIRPQTTEVACLWLLHPRLQTKACMQPFADSTIGDWNARLWDGRTRSKEGLIAVAFDQRNHGSREVDKVANEAWRGGNPKHAQDMFSCYRRFSILFPTSINWPDLTDSLNVRRNRNRHVAPPRLHLRLRFPH